LFVGAHHVMSATVEQNGWQHTSKSLVVFGGSRVVHMYVSAFIE
jgi:hypothetical protein